MWTTFIKDAAFCLFFGRRRNEFLFCANLASYEVVSVLKVNFFEKHLDKHMTFIEIKTLRLGLALLTDHTSPDHPSSTFTTSLLKSIRPLAVSENLSCVDAACFCVTLKQEVSSR